MNLPFQSKINRSDQNYPPVLYKMKQVPMTRDFQTNSNRGGRGCNGFSSSLARIDSGRLDYRGSNAGCEGGVTFPPTYAILPNATHETHATTHFHPPTNSQVIPHPRNDMFVLPPSTPSPSNCLHVNSTRTVPGSFPPQDAHTGYSLPMNGALNHMGPTHSYSVPGHGLSPKQCYEKYRGMVAGDGRSRNNQYQGDYSDCGTNQQIATNHTHGPTSSLHPQEELFPPSAMRKGPPPHSVGSLETQKKPPPPSSLGPQQESQDRRHREHDLKPPPPLLMPLRSTQSRRTKRRDRLGIRGDPLSLTFPALPTRVPSVDDEDLFFNEYSEEQQNNRRPPSPRLSPISLSSSMFRNHSRMNSFYPSKDCIEQQTTHLPTLDVVPSTMVTPRPFQDQTTSQGTRINPGTKVRVVSPDDHGGRDTTSAKAGCHSEAKASCPDAPKGVTDVIVENRPKKPHRVDSRVPSGPCPLVDGGGVINRIVTRIDTDSTRNDHQQPPKASNIEYDLQLFPAPPMTQLRSSPSINQHRLKKLPDLGGHSDDVEMFKPPIQVEIYPGESRILRGARETARAAERNFVVSCTCLICTTTFSCIADAEFVICPCCRVVNPLGLVVTGSHDFGNLNRWGVGLGFVPDECP